VDGHGTISGLGTRGSGLGERWYSEATGRCTLPVASELHRRFRAPSPESRVPCRCGWRAMLRHDVVPGGHRPRVRGD
jgi:hypothetical protein